MLHAGESLSTVANLFGLSKSALSRHRADHLKAAPGVVVQVVEKRIRDLADAGATPATALAAVDQLQAETWRILRELRNDDTEAGVVRTELQAIRELREGIALRARLTGELQPAGPGRAAQPEPEVAGMSDAQLREEWERLNEGAPSGATVN